MRPYVLLALAIPPVLGCELAQGERVLAPPRVAALASAPNFVEDVQPILMEYCSPCHLGASADACIGATCMPLFYESLTWYSCCLPPYAGYITEPIEGCGETRVADCSLARVRTFAANGKDPLPPDQVEILEAWLAGGIPHGPDVERFW